MTCNKVLQKNQNVPAPETVLPTPPVAPPATPLRSPLPRAPVVSPTVLLTPEVVFDRVLPTLLVVSLTPLPAEPPTVFPVQSLVVSCRKTLETSRTYQGSCQHRQQACWHLCQHRQRSCRHRFQRRRQSVRRPWQHLRRHPSHRPLRRHPKCPYPSVSSYRQHPRQCC